MAQTGLVLTGTLGRDTVSGGGGNDILRGAAGNDVLSGGGGDDRLVGGRGDDVLALGAGRDVAIFNAGDGQDRITDFVRGTDKLELRGMGPGAVTARVVAAGVELSFASGGKVLLEGLTGLNAGDVTADGAALPAMGRALPAGSDPFATEGNDTLTGTLGPDVMSGAGGDDILRGAAGNDVLSGGGGDDRLVGGRGDDVLTLGAGRDVAIFNGGDGQDRITDFVRGTDTLELRGMGPGEVTARVVAAGVELSFAAGGKVLLEGLTGLNAGDVTANGMPFQLPQQANVIEYFGVNLAGGSFGRDTGGSETSSTPVGIYGQDYIYPTIQEIDYFASKGMNTIRLSFLWERIQASPYQPLKAGELALIDPLIDHATDKGMTVILDMHNYGFGFGGRIGASSTTVDAFADIWAKLAEHYEANPNVMFGLMNEPHVHTASEWLVAANAAIAAIRETGATQKILVPGSYWDGAWTWVSSDNDTVMGPGVRDPLQNFAFDVHQYLDAEANSFSPVLVSETIGSERLADITQWARANGHELFLTEFGTPGDASSLRALENLVSYMEQHADVWKGATYWAAGPWWGDYMHTVEPIGLGTDNVIDRPQMQVLDRYELLG